MQSEHETTRDFEDLLRMAVEAEQAGVFRPTPADPAAIMSDPHRNATRDDASRQATRESESGFAGHRLVLRLGRLAGSLAACLVIAVGISQIWPAGGGQSSHVANLSQSTGATMLVDSVERCSSDFTLFNTCFTGPSIDGLTSDCRCVDFDRDGDVDFADFGLMQRASAMSNG